MSARHPAWTIYRKELLDTLRDRRTLAAMLLVPMVAYPVALLVTSETIAVERRAHEGRLASVQRLTRLPAPIEDRLQASDKIDSIFYDADNKAVLDTDRKARADAARTSLEAGVDVVLAMSATSAAAFDTLGTGAVELYYDSTDPFSNATVDRLEHILGTINDEARALRMTANDLPATAAEPLILRTITVASEHEIQGQLLGSLLPALVLVFIAISCFYPAVDLTAGEKERRTLATLLTAPVRTRDIVLGKYLAVVTIGTLAGLLNVTTLGLTMLRVFTSDPIFGPIQFELTGPAVIGIAIGVITIAAPLAAVMLLFACLARSFRDASYLLTPVLLVAAIPAILSALPSFVLSPKLAAIPLANAALLLKATFSGEVPLGASIIVLVVAAATTAALLALVERVFGDERVLFSTSGPRADLESLLAKPPRLGLETGLALAALVFVFDYYAGLFTGSMSPLAQVIVMQVVCHVGVALLYALWNKRVVPARQMLATTAFTARDTIGAVLIGAGAWLGLSLPSAWLTEAIFPGQAEASAAFSAALDLGATPILLLVFALAIVPAISEELLFRGVLQRVVGETVGATQAVWVQAAVFGLFHGSIYRLLPTFLLGVVLGELRRRTGSVWPGVIAHVMTNSILLLIDRTAPATVMDTLAQPTVWAMAGLVLVIVAHVAVDSDRAKQVHLA